MGQRTQLIVKLPEVYYNENNSNNRPESIKVYHNQWLYGINFIKYLARLIKAIEVLRKGDFDLNRCEERVDDAIKHCNYADLDYMTETRKYNEEGYNYNLDLNESKTILDFLDKYDNNNGYMYVSIGKDGIKYCILNGTEDADTIEVKTPKEYINLFYTDDKIKDETELLEAIKFLDSCQKTDVFEELKLFKKKVGKMITKQVAEVL